jgi:hypothetical protein
MGGGWVACFCWAAGFSDPIGAKTIQWIIMAMVGNFRKLERVVGKWEKII